MPNPNEQKQTPPIRPQWSDALQAPTAERTDPRLRTLTAIEHSVISCAESLSRAFDNLKEVEKTPSDSDMPLRAALHALNESLQALNPIQRLTARAPEQMRELFACISETSGALRSLIIQSQEALNAPAPTTRASKVRQIILACPRITDGLENALVIPLKVTKQEMLGGTDTPQSLTA